MADNPFFKNKEAEYRQFAIAFLHNLKYLDYELIDEETREKAVEKHKEELQEFEVSKNQEGNEEEKQLDPELKEAKLDCTVGMINKIINEDEDTKILMAFPKFLEILDPFRNDIEESTTKYHTEMKVKHREKKNTLFYCEQVLREAEKEAEKESIKLID